MGGGIYVVKDRIFLAESFKRHELKFINDKFVVVDFKERLSKDSLGEGSHLLAFYCDDKDNGDRIMYDGRPLIEPIILRLHEQLFIDDNAPCFKLPIWGLKFSGDIFEQRPGFFNSLITIKEGEGNISLLWRKIRVIVSEEPVTWLETYPIPYPQNNNN
jgi:hypothetical protein